MTGFEDTSMLVLAGGRGSRISHIHPGIPKPMLPVAGKPFLHWLTLLVARHGLDHFVYSSGHLSEQVEAWCADGSMPGISRVACREQVPLGTGGGALNCLHLCRDWVLVGNGDGLCMKGIADLLALRETGRVDGGLIGVSVEDAARYGSLDFGADGRLAAFREKVPGRGYVNSGLYLFRRALLEPLKSGEPSSMELDLIPTLLEQGADLRVVAVEDAAFIDIGTPETLAEAEAFVRRHLLEDAG